MRVVGVFTHRRSSCGQPGDFRNRIDFFVKTLLKFGANRPKVTVIEHVCRVVDDEGPDQAAPEWPPLYARTVAIDRNDAALAHEREVEVGEIPTAVERPNQVLEPHLRTRHRPVVAGEAKPANPIPVDDRRWADLQILSLAGPEHQ